MVINLKSIDKQYTGNNKHCIIPFFSPRNENTERRKEKQKIWTVIEKENNFVCNNFTPNNFLFVWTKHCSCHKHCFFSLCAVCECMRITNKRKIQQQQINEGDQRHTQVFILRVLISVFSQCLSLVFIRPKLTDSSGWTSGWSKNILLPKWKNNLDKLFYSCFGQVDNSLSLNQQNKQFKGKPWDTLVTTFSVEHRVTTKWVCFSHRSNLSICFGPCKWVRLICGDRVLTDRWSFFRTNMLCSLRLRSQSVCLRSRRANEVVFSQCAMRIFRCSGKDHLHDTL